MLFSIPMIIVLGLRIRKFDFVFMSLPLIVESSDHTFSA
jgi:hypothetical protein